MLEGDNRLYDLPAFHPADPRNPVILSSLHAVIQQNWI